MAERQYVCAYKYCLHHGQKVSSSESVVIAKRHYHLDCADMKQKIQSCAYIYLRLVEDKSQYPIVLRILNTLVFKNKIPVEYILKNITNASDYYKDKPVYVLYGMRKKFWEDILTHDI